MHPDDFFNSNPQFNPLKTLTPLLMPEAVASVKDVTRDMSQLLTGATKPRVHRYNTWLARQYDQLLYPSAPNQHPSVLLAERGFRLPTSQEIELSPFQTLNSWAIALWPVTDHPSCRFECPWAFNGLFYSMSVPPTVRVFDESGHARTTAPSAYYNTRTWELQNATSKDTVLDNPWVVRTSGSSQRSPDGYSTGYRVDLLGFIGRVIHDNRQSIHGGVTRNDLVKMVQGSWSEIMSVSGYAAHDPSEENARLLVSKFLDSGKEGDLTLWPVPESSTGVLFGPQELQLLSGWAQNN